MVNYFIFRKIETFLKFVLDFFSTEKFKKMSNCPILWGHNVF